MVLSKLQQLGARPLSRPVTMKELKQLGAKIDGKLPASYCDMLMTFGGAHFSEAVYYFDSSINMPVMFGGFFDFDYLVRVIKYPETLPNGVIPIGDDGGGNQYCLGVNGDDFDKVFFHDHCIGWSDEAWSYLERGEELPLHLRYETVVQLAETFEEFVDGLFIGED